MSDGWGVHGLPREHDWPAYPLAGQYPMAKEGEDRCPILYTEGEDKTRCLLVPHPYGPDGIGHLSNAKGGSRVRWMEDTGWMEAL